MVCNRIAYSKDVECKNYSAWSNTTACDMILHAVLVLNLVLALHVVTACSVSTECSITTAC